MTKQQAEAEFRAHHLPTLFKTEAEGTGRVDRPRRAEAWDMYMDDLSAARQITDHQYMSWHQPRWVFTKRCLSPLHSMTKESY